MRTPVRQGYGKRKRHSYNTEISWDLSIDSSPVVDNAVSSKISLNAVKTPLRQVGPSKDTSDTPESAVKRKHDVYDFDLEHKPTRPRRDHRRDPSNDNGHTSHARTVIKSRVQPAHDDESVDKSPSRFLETSKANSLFSVNHTPRVDKGKGKLMRTPDRKPRRSASDSINRDIDLAITLSKAEARALSYIDVGPSKMADTAANKQIDTAYPDSPLVPSIGMNRQSPRAARRKSHQHDESLPTAAEVPVPCPPARPQTPIPQLIEGIKSPQPSPQTDAIYDLFAQDTETSNLTTTKPRRILRQLSKLGASPIKRQISTVDDEVVKSHLDTLLESAENNLLEQSQTSDAIENLPLEESFSSNADIEQGLFRQIAPSSTRLTYSKQRSGLADSAFPAAELSQNETTAISDGSDTETDEVEYTSPKAVRNLHDLRHGGENKRFIDQANYMLEGLDSSGTVLATMVELGQKLSDKDFARRFRATGMQDKVWRTIESISDPATLFASTVVMVNLSQHAEQPIFDSNQRTILEQALRHEKDIQDYLDIRSLRVSKMNKLSILDLRKEVARSPVFHESKQDYRLSPRLLSLMSMNLSSSYGSGSQNDIKLIQALFNGLSDDETSSNQLEIQLTSAVLETLDTRALSKLSADQVGTLCQTLLTLSRVKSPSPHVSPSTCNLLRLLISLSQDINRNLQPLLPKDFSTELLEIVLRRVKILKQDSHETDEVVLMLGLLVSLAEDSNELRQSLSECLIADKVMQAQMAATIEGGIREKQQETVSGYVALLLFHLCRKDASTSPQDPGGKLVVDRDLIHKGLKLLQKTLRQDVSGENEFMRSLSDHIASFSS